MLYILFFIIRIEKHFIFYILYILFQMGSITRIVNLLWFIFE